MMWFLVESMQFYGFLLTYSFPFHLIYNSFVLELTMFLFRISRFSAFRKIKTSLSPKLIQISVKPFHRQQNPVFQMFSSVCFLLIQTVYRNTLIFC